MKEYITKSATDAQRKHEHHKIFKKIDFFVLHPLPETIDIRQVIKAVESKIPSYYASNIDAFYIAHLKEFDLKDTNAMYKDGAVYISNRQEDVQDMVDDIIHEIAHAIEENHSDYFYSDERIQQEFLGKRKRLYDTLRQYGHIKDNNLDFMNLEYSHDLDMFFYENVGYEKLENFCMGLFVRPYGCTDLREYFATSFEEYILGDRDYVKKVCPRVYSKIIGMNKKRG